MKERYTSQKGLARDILKEVDKRDLELEIRLTEAYYEHYDFFYKSVGKQLKELEDRIIVLEELMRSMRLPEELTIGGRAYLAKRPGAHHE